MATKKIDIRNHAGLIFILWTACIGVILGWNYSNLRKETHEIALKEARAYFNKDQAFRFWATSHGGVYVPLTDKTPPNPFLSHVLDRDIITSSGKKLTLMNHAYMIRQMMEDYSDLYGVKGRITSLKPLRPENGPDEWEIAALQSFEQGNKEVTEIAEIQGEPFIRLMQPMFVREGCIKCHGHQGYKVGDVRGGVSVSVPLVPLLAIEKKNAGKLMLAHVLVWAIGMLGISFSSRNIYKKIKESESAQEEANQWMNAFHYAKWGVVIVSADGQTLERMNPEFAKMHGYTLEGLTGKSIVDFFPAEKRVEAQEHIKTAREEYHRVFESVHIKKDGTKFPVLVDVTAVKDVNGRVKYRVVNVQDITERKRTTEELENVFSLSSDLICVASMTHFLKVNPSTEQILGYTEEELLKVPFIELIHPDDVEPTSIKIEEDLKKGIPAINFVNRYRHKDGFYRWLEWTTNPIPEKGLLYGVARDITERRKTTKELENIFSLSPDLICIASTTHFLKTSPSFTRTLGYTDEELIERPFIEFIHPDDVEPTRKVVQDKLEKGEPVIAFVNRYRHKDGSYVWLDWVTTPVLEEGLFYALARDITEKKNIERALLESRESFKALVEFTSAIHWEFDLIKGWFTYVSPQSEVMTGFRPEEWTDFNSWSNMIHPDDRIWAVDHCIKHTKENRDHDFIYRVVTKQGEIRWLRDIVKIISENNHPVKLIGLMFDITEQKLAEEKISSSLKEKEVLLREVHHRVKNNMAIISALLKMQSAYIKDEEDLEMFEESQGRIRSMALVHEKLYKTKSFAEINVHEYLQSLIEGIKETFSGKKPVEIIFEVEDLSIDMDILIPSGLIINELLTNSYKHAFDSIENPQISIILESLEDNIQLTISDNGIGLPDGFDISESTGLGFKLVIALCGQIKGSLSYETDNGTMFKLKFPKALPFARV